MKFIRKIQKQLSEINSSPYKIAVGFSSGVFASFSPFIGFHFVLALVGCFFLRGSYISGLIGTVVGNPFTFPFIYLATFSIGGLFAKTKDYNSFLEALEKLRHSESGFFMLIQDLFITLEPFLMTLIIGWFVVGGVVSGLIFLILLRLVTKAKNIKIQTIQE